MSEAAGDLESIALKRKARLEQMKQKAAKKPKPDDEIIQQSLPKPIFRNYDPSNEDLKNQSRPNAEPGEVVDHIQEELENQNVGVEIEQLDFTNLAPRKPDWDLKRDIASKLEKLEKMKQRAIAELIHERLQKEEDLADAVNTGASAERQMAQYDD